MKYYLICGEKSGDIHAANLVKSIKEIDNTAVFRVWGGDALQKLNVPVVKHISELSYMGLVEVLSHLRTIRNNFKFAHKDIQSFNPDVIILVDFPGFNLRIARWAKLKGFKVFYYISPTVWAWHQSRVFQIKKYVDRLFVILPFEKEFYKQFDIEVDYFGHPIVDALNEILDSNIDKENFLKKWNLSDKPIIAILPGSRKQEIRKILPMMTTLSQYFSDYNWVVAGLSFIPQSEYSVVEQNPNIRIIIDDTYNLLKLSHAAIVTSGTATLETALFNVPQVVCYKTNLITYLIARMLVKVKYISLVNLILQKEAVKELIQQELTIENLKKELFSILKGDQRKAVLENYSELRRIIGLNCAVSSQVAKRMIELLQK